MQLNSEQMANIASVGYACPHASYTARESCEQCARWIANELFTRQTIEVDDDAVREYVKHCELPEFESACCVAVENLATEYERTVEQLPEGAEFYPED